MDTDEITICHKVDFDEFGAAILYRVVKRIYQGGEQVEVDKIGEFREGHPSFDSICQLHDSELNTRDSIAGCVPIEKGVDIENIID